MKQKFNLKKTSPLIWFGLFMFLIIGIVYLFSNTDTVKSLPKSDFAKKDIFNYKDVFGQEHSKVEVDKNDKSQFYKSQIDSLKKQLNVKEKEIIAITEVQASLVDSIKLIKIKYDAEKHKVWEWQKKYASGSKIEARMSEKDSVLQLTNVDIKILATDTYKKRFFKPDIYNVDLFSTDQNIKFNGVKVYRYEKLIKPKRFGLGLQFGYGLGQNFQFYPYIGFGVSYNLINF